MTGAGGAGRAGAPVPLDLATATVVLDVELAGFEVEPAVYVLERAGRPGWEPAALAWERGAVPTRIRRTVEAAHLPGAGEAAELAAAVPVDPQLGPLAHDLVAARAELVVVSDGLGLVNGRVAALVPPEARLAANALDPTTGELELPHADWSCPCTTCGVCKQRPLVDARRRGRTPVLVGAALADHKAALLADVVFARDALAGWCEAAGVAFAPFSDLGDVRRSLLGQRPDT